MSKEEEDKIIETNGNDTYDVFAYRMFTDDKEVFTFARRCAWSPDGAFFIVPCGYYQENASSETQYVSYGFLRHETNDPAFILPSNKTCPVVVRFCPFLFH